MNNIPAFVSSTFYIIYLSLVRTISLYLTLDVSVSQSCLDFHLDPEVGIILNRQTFNAIKLMDMNEWIVVGTLFYIWSKFLFCIHFSIFCIDFWSRMVSVVRNRLQNKIETYLKQHDRHVTILIEIFITFNAETFGIPYFPKLNIKKCF